MVLQLTKHGKKYFRCCKKNENVGEINIIEMQEDN